MPTSSQCLILQKTINNRPVSGRITPCLFKEPAKCHIATVYNLGGCTSLTATSVADRDAKFILGQEAAQLFKYHELPHGFSSVLEVNQRSGNLHWHALGGIDNKDNIATHRSEMKVTDRTSLSLTDARNPRPHTAMPRPSSKMIVDPLAYNSLVHLGFRKSSLGMREDCIIDSFSGRKGIASRPLRTPKATAICSSSPNVTEPRDLKVVVPHNSSNTSEASSDADDELDFESLDYDDDTGDGPEELTRIKPSMFMRKDTPEVRPRTAVFSFRDNEFSSHSEVKYLIEKQIGVKVKAVQFDPLDVRATYPGVHSRWLVDFISDWDMHVALKKGLICGKDKLVFFKHDDIAKREVSSFKYFKTVQDAKKKLKSKVSSPKKPSVGKRETKSLGSLKS